LGGILLTENTNTTTKTDTKNNRKRLGSINQDLTRKTRYHVIIIISTGIQETTNRNQQQYQTVIPNLSEALFIRDQHKSNIKNQISQYKAGQQFNTNVYNLVTMKSDRQIRVWELGHKSLVNISAIQSSLRKLKAV